jgi:hypothetical protein
MPILLTDEALKDGARRKDSLNFKRYAESLAKAATLSPAPLTIGIFGEWGTGKTSLLQLVRNKVEEDSRKAKKKVLTVWFNAWQYDRDELPLVPLVATILKAAPPQDSQLSKLVNALRALLYGISAKTRLFGAEVGIDTKAMIDREEKLNKEEKLTAIADRIAEHSLAYQAYESLSSTAQGTDQRIVVFIDDLDRCLPENAIRLLEGIKLVMAQPGFVFVLGVSRPIIEGYLDRLYKDEIGLKDFRGAAYLDKLIQLPFTIPPHTPRMMDLASTLLEEVSKDPPAVTELLAPILKDTAPHLDGNPRALVRFINSMIFDLAVHTEASEPGFLPFIAVTRLLQQRWPAFYKAVVYADFARVKGDKKGRSLQGQPSDNGGTTTALLNEDPGLKAFARTASCREWLRDSAKRIRAVYFMSKSVIGPASPPMPLPAPSDQFVTIVAAKQPKAAEWVRNALIHLEDDIEFDHKTYLASSDFSPPSDAQIKYIWLAGRNEKGIPGHYQRVALPEDQEAAAVIAAEHLRELREDLAANARASV